MKDSYKYDKLRKKYLAEHPMCKARIKGVCQCKATDIHHTFDGADRMLHYTDTETWIPVCRKCHDWIHSHSLEAKQLKLLK